MVIIYRNNVRLEANTTGFSTATLGCRVLRMVQGSPPTAIIVLAFSLSGRLGETFRIQQQHTGIRSWRRCKSCCLRQSGGLLPRTSRSPRLWGQTAIGQAGGAQGDYPPESSDEIITNISSGQTRTDAKDAQVVADYTSGGCVPRT